MRHSVERHVLRAAIVGAAILSLAAGGQATAEELHQKWLKYFAGGWKAQYAAGHSTWYKNELVAGGHALLHVNPTDDGVFLIGWRPDTKTFVQTVYAADGAFFQTEYSDLAEKSLRVSGCGVLASGAVFKGTGELRQIDQDNYEITSEVESDIWKFSGTDRFTRQDSQQASAKVSTKSDRGVVPVASLFDQNRLDFAAGNWHTTSIPGHDSPLNVRVAAGGRALVGTSPEGAVFVAGWRPDTKAFVWISHQHNGGYGQSRYTDFSEHSLRGTTVCLLSPTATAMRGNVCLQRLSEDHYRLTSGLQLGTGKLTVTQDIHRQKSMAAR
jgi:hypothetical protein